MPLRPCLTSSPLSDRNRFLNRWWLSLSRAYQLSEQNLSPEFIALDLQKALEELGSLIGTTTSEDVLDRVFSRFCIGK